SVSFSSVVMAASSEFGAASDLGAPAFLGILIVPPNRTAPTFTRYRSALYHDELLRARDFHGSYGFRFGLRPCRNERPVRNARIRQTTTMAALSMLDIR